MAGKEHSFGSPSAPVSKSLIKQKRRSSKQFGNPLICRGGIAQELGTTTSCLLPPVSSLPLQCRDANKSEIRSSAMVGISQESGRTTPWRLVPVPLLQDQCRDTNDSGISSSCMAGMTKLEPLPPESSLPAQCLDTNNVDISSVVLSTVIKPDPEPLQLRVGCLNGDEMKLDKQAHNEVNLFRQAIAMLPIKDMPELLRSVICGGACLGLLDPVSNIILGAVSYLERLENPPLEEVARRASRTIQQQQCEASQNRIMDYIDMEFVEKIGLTFAAGRSRNSLIMFMQNYFCYLTKEQAERFIDLAGSDLTIAVKLVYHDRFAATHSVPDPTSNRTQTALKQAARNARLLASDDDFVLLATSRYPRDMLEKATARLLRKEKLSCSDIKLMMQLMLWRSRDASNLDDPNLTHLTILRRPEDMATKVTCCLESALKLTRNPGRHRSSSCEYHHGLKLHLLDSIHVLFLQALARLPSKSLCKHLRGILMGGHCFGPLDPVSNIICNAVWYDMAFPLEYSEDNKPADVLDNRSLLRMERRSLDGLTTLFARFLCGSYDTVLFEQDALEYLCKTNCDMSRDVYLPTETFTHETALDYFTHAACAAKHPKPAYLGFIHASLGKQDMESITYLLSAEQISHDALQQLYNILRPFTQIGAPDWPVNNLSQQAWKLLVKEQNNFKVRQSFIRKMVDLTLCDYNSSRTEEPIYKLHAICGVARSISCSTLTCYHVNFLARPDCELSGCILFFLEFFASCTLDEENKLSFVHEKEKPFFCCPVLMSCDLGRCCHCEKISSKIVHPLSRVYDSSNGQNSAYSFPVLNLLHEYVIDVDVELETDYIYFDIKRDSRLSRYLNKIGAKQEF
ncbi:hypothetical protein EJB05_46200 [Eragrostis curvula]|uniref:Uncharacterized protein n=1 Tax=Eragrostis curvula TaxID=38414 RepID=A0A5J9TMC5_9POAL|nr:hypothetical protein EJB05_46200 [Eragrostis curvula]